MSYYEELLKRCEAFGMEIGYKLEMIKNMVDGGISLDKALKYAKLDRETYETHKDHPADGADQ